MSTMKWHSTVATLTLALAAGCGGGDGGGSAEGEYFEAVPELGAVELSITGDAESEALATEGDRVGEAASEAAASVEMALGEGAPSLRGARRSVRELNQALRSFLQPIAALARTEPDERTGNLATWGPVVRGQTEYRFVMRKGLLRRYGWLLEARPEGSEAGFLRVASGRIRLGSVVRRGWGTVGVDLDALGSVDPTVAARGQVLSSFAHRPSGAAVSHGLRDFAPAGDTTPLDALFQGVHLVGGRNRVRVAVRTNLPETDTEAEELVLARVRHHRGDGGRADLIATGGDVAEGRAWAVSECWSGGLASTYRRVLDCPGDGPGGEGCELVSESGDRSACLGALAEAEWPPVDPEERMQDGESPEPDLLPPTGMPSGEADDADGE